LLHAIQLPSTGGFYPSLSFSQSHNDYLVSFLSSFDSNSHLLSYLKAQFYLISSAKTVKTQGKPALFLSRFIASCSEIIVLFLLSDHYSLDVSEQLSKQDPNLFFGFLVPIFLVLTISRYPHSLSRLAEGASSRPP
jgi:hypothetical protein